MLRAASFVLCCGGAAAGGGRNRDSACAVAAAAHGCDVFCGFEAVAAGDTHVCVPSSGRRPFPFGIGNDDAAELCELSARGYGCCGTCGFRWSAEAAECRHVSELLPMGGDGGKVVASNNATSRSEGPIVGGSGKYRYQYMPDRVQAPAGAVMQNCHGLAIDADDNIILTYQNDGKTDPHCLIRWNPDGTGGEFASNETAGLCVGTPHGLKIVTEPDGQFLYHANNAQKLAKTTLDGEVVWEVDGNFGQNDTCLPDSCPLNSCHCTGGKLPYIPTWFATPPDSDYMYLSDGYGSDHVYAFERATGRYLNKSWGGRSPAGLQPGAAGPTQPHGLFMENHGCTYDPRNTTDPHTIVVSDRRNMRFEFFHYDPARYDTFDWYKTVDFSASMGPTTLPCNMRMYPEQDNVAIVPDLAGPVAILNSDHEVLSVVNVSVLLAAEQHLHPHDAVILPSGDIVVATWAPGRISYWKHLPEEEQGEEKGEKWGAKD